MTPQQKLSFAKVAGKPATATGTTGKRRGRRGKGQGKRLSESSSTGPPNKKTKANHPFKMEVWEQDKDGRKAPLSLANWKQMNKRLVFAAANKVRADGPPRGGIGMKHWLQHTYPGSEKAMELPEDKRLGHTVLRFSTLEDQEWFRPLVREVLGKDLLGGEVSLAVDVESDDDRARYSVTLTADDFMELGQDTEEREALILDLVLYAIGIVKDSPDGKSSEINSSRIIKTEGKEDQWTLALRLPLTVEAMLDTILMGQRFGFLPTAIGPMRVFKQSKNKSAEEALIRGTESMDVNGKRQRESPNGTGNDAKKKADQQTPK